MRFIAGFIVALIVVCLAGLAYIYSGGFNVGATARDPQILEWVLSTTMDRSVKVHARDVHEPGPLSDEHARQGYRLYSRSCVLCHGAPGKEASAIGKGLNPEPPSLADVAGEWEAGELFWIIENGIKMSGMPAFGPTQKPEEIWNVVAFVQRLPKMTAEQYNEMGAASAAPTAAPSPAPK